MRWPVDGQAVGGWLKLSLAGGHGYRMKRNGLVCLVGLAIRGVGATLVPSGPAGCTGSIRCCVRALENERFPRLCRRRLTYRVTGGHEKDSCWVCSQAGGDGLRLRLPQSAYRPSHRPPLVPRSRLLLYPN